MTFEKKNVAQLFFSAGRATEPYPTDPFSNLESENPWIEDFHVAQKRQSTDFNPVKLEKDR